MSDVNVTYTIKEILARMEARADERHAEAMREIGDLKRRATRLEQDKARSEGAVDQKARIYATILAAITIIVNAPAAWSALMGSPK